MRLKSKLMTLAASGLVATTLIAKEKTKEPSPPKSATNKTAEDDSNNRYKSLETLARGLFYLETMYVDPDKVHEEEMARNALKGITDHLDPHTVLMPPKAFEQMTIDTQGKFGGIGIVVSQENNKITVMRAIDDTPASKAGIQAGDEITEIDGVQLTNQNPNDILDRMRGAPGSTVKLTIIRKNSAQPLKFNLKREIVEVKSVQGQPLEDSTLYARIASFQENTADELEALIEKYSSNKLTGLILDLRDNPGGLLDQAVGVADLFIESGIIVSTVGRDKDKVEREFARKRGTVPNFPVVVLINGGSASASEIVAGALQDHERALLVGTTSFGKGSVQTLLSLPDGSGLKLTVARYYTPKDRSIQAKGIRPDIVVSERSITEKDDAAKRKEADLKGHIESADLSDMATNQGITKAISSWPEYMRKDLQLTTGFTYLKSYAMFQRRNMNDRK